MLYLTGKFSLVVMDLSTEKIETVTVNETIREEPFFVNIDENKEFIYLCSPILSMSSNYSQITKINLKSLEIVSQSSLIEMSTSWGIFPNSRYLYVFSFYDIVIVSSETLEV